MSRLELRRVEFMPKELEPSVLYVSEEFEVAGHLCACGCGNKVITPLGHTGWTVREEDGKPTVLPSIGSWQLACRSHYWIRRGEIVWAEDWSESRIQAGRRAEEARLRAWEESLAASSRADSTGSNAPTPPPAPQLSAGLVPTAEPPEPSPQAAQPTTTNPTSFLSRIWRWIRALVRRLGL